MKKDKQLKQFVTELLCPRSSFRPYVIFTLFCRLVMAGLLGLICLSLCFANFLKTVPQ